MIIGLACPVVLLVALFYCNSTKVERMPTEKRNYCEVVHAGVPLERIYSKAQPEVDGDMVYWEYPRYVKMEGLEYMVSTDDASVDGESANLKMEEGETAYLSRLYDNHLLLSRKPLRLDQIQKYNQTYYAQDSGLASAGVAILLMWLVGGVLVVFKRP